MRKALAHIEKHYKISDSIRNQLAKELNIVRNKFPLYRFKCPSDLPFDLFLVKNKNELSSGLFHNWNCVAPASAQVIKNILPSFSSDLNMLANSSIDILSVENMFYENNLPETPLRKESVHSANTPNYEFIVDYILHGISHILGKKGAFVQNNISLVNIDGKIDALKAHIDRGTYISLLGCMRRGSDQITKFQGIESFFCNFSKTVRDYFLHNVDGKYCLRDRFIEEEYTWDEIKNEVKKLNLEDWVILKTEEKSFNSTLTKDYDHFSQRNSYSLNEGDILIFNNKYWVHGRTEAQIKSRRNIGNENPDKRWLRVLFL